MSTTTPSSTPKTEQRESLGDGGSAFPVTHLVTINGDVANVGATGGMSLRDYFAAKAMAAMVSSWREINREHNKQPSQGSHHLDYVEPKIEDLGDPEMVAGLAEAAYVVADSMLRARKSGGAA